MRIAFHGYLPQSGSGMHANPKAGSALGPAEQKVKLEELVRYLHELIVIFEKDEIASSEPYQLLTRLFKEHANVHPIVLKNRFR